LSQGDTSQVDLPKYQPSGLIQATRLLKNIDGIEFVTLDATDVVRHRLVRDIIHAYDKEPAQEKDNNRDYKGRRPSKRNNQEQSEKESD
jgi:phosphate starvation-inducible PhoH-like protein